MSKTTLCLTCEYGLVREYDCEVDTCRLVREYGCEADTCKEQHFMNKCLLGDDYVGIITSCNKYRKDKKAKVTYHDPDFKDYEKKAMEGE